MRMTDSAVMMQHRPFRLPRRAGRINENGSIRTRDAPLYIGKEVLTDIVTAEKKIVVTTDRGGHPTITERNHAFDTQDPVPDIQYLIQVLTVANPVPGKNDGRFRIGNHMLQFSAGVTGVQTQPDAADCRCRQKNNQVIRMRWR